MSKVTPEILINYWSLTNVHVEKLLQQSGERSTYLISAHEGRFVLKIVDTLKTKPEILRDTFVFDFLREEGFTHIPKLQPTSNGAQYVEVDSRFAILLEYITGEIPQSTAKNWSMLGEITAKLHQIQNYPYATSFTVKTERPRFLEGVEQLSFKKEYLALTHQLPDFIDLTQCLIHTDIGLHNTIKNQNGDMMLIDWDDAGVGARILDIGYPLICQFVSLDLIIDADNARSFYQSYLKSQSLTAVERDSLFDAGLFFALMYLKYGDSNKNWQRIQYALKNKRELAQLFE